MKTSDRDRRLGFVRVPAEQQWGLLRTGTTVESGLPDDARFMYHIERPRYQADDFVFRSDEFDVVPEGGSVPRKIVRLHVPGEDESGGLVNEPTPRQVKLITMSNEVFSYLFHEGTEVIDGIAKDSRVRRFWRCDESLQYEFMIENPTFDEKEKGAVAPRADFDITVDDGNTELSKYLQT